MKLPERDTTRKRLYAGAAVLAALLAVLLFVLPAAGVTMPWDSNALQTVASDEDSATDTAEVTGDGEDNAEAPADDAASADDAAASSDQAAAEGDASAVASSATGAGTGQAGASSDGQSGASSASSGGGGAASSASTGSASAAGGGSKSAQAPFASGSTQQQQAAPAPATITVTVTIDASNAHKVNASYPSSMGSKQVTVPAGASVYDALKATGASIGGSSTYVSSINGLAEKACGSGSGWMYKVNGVYPNYACGKYKLQGGESIVWAYTVTKGDVS
ncbi:DUF4430 domain-containing protein [Hugonella massiliensis]|uniref:DUF4430 domain-containing protein n=1 Tax=Hugonella massiliensis TaxID=1720315 RepID=UPI00073F49A6|nr:DUF4430 domain-containing protein [Hugonella massiliensis]